MTRRAAIARALRRPAEDEPVRRLTRLRARGTRGRAGAASRSARRSSRRARRRGRSSTETPVAISPAPDARRAGLPALWARAARRGDDRDRAPACGRRGGPTLDDVVRASGTAWSRGLPRRAPCAATRSRQRCAGIVPGRAARGTAVDSLRRMSVADDRAELAQLEEEWMSAMQARDMDRLEELVAPTASASRRSTSTPSRCPASSGWARRARATRSSRSRSSAWTSTSSATPG